MNIAIRASKYRYQKPVLSSIPNTGIEIQEIPVFQSLKMGYFWEFLGKNQRKKWKFFNVANLDNEILISIVIRYQFLPLIEVEN